MAKFVRIKPLNREAGAVVDRYVSPFGNLFNVKAGWYEVSDEEADYLSRVHVDPYKPHTPLVFDVCPSIEEAASIEEQEKLALLNSLGAVEHRGPTLANRPSSTGAAGAGRVNLPSEVRHTPAKAIGRAGSLANIGQAKAPMATVLPVHEDEGHDAPLEESDDGAIDGVQTPAPKAPVKGGKKGGKK